MNFLDAADYYIRKALNRVQINLRLSILGLPPQSGYESKQEEPKILLMCTKPYHYCNGNTCRTFKYGDKIFVKRWERTDEYSLDRTYFKIIRK